MTNPPFYLLIIFIFNDSLMTLGWSLAFQLKNAAARDIFIANATAPFLFKQEVFQYKYVI
jgi:hypothetical protein